MSDSQNRESCDTIESATYGICLDEGHPMLSIVHEVSSLVCTMHSAFCNNALCNKSCNVHNLNFCSFFTGIL